MTGTYFRRRQHAVAKKVAAFFLAFVASLAAADPTPPPSQSVELPAASTTADARIGPPGNAPLKRQPVAMPGSAGPGVTADVEIQRRSDELRRELLNELRRELLDDRAKTVDWWLAATAIFLTLFGIVAVIAGYLNFKKLREIEAEARRNMESSGKHAEKARNLVGEIKAEARRNVEASRKHTEEARNLVSEIKAWRDKAESLAKGLTAEAVHNDPDEARRAAESVQENPTASPIYQAVAAAVLLQSQGNIEEAIEKWRTIANVVDGIDKETGAQAWFSIGYLSQEHRKNDLETAIDAYDEAIRLKPDLAEAYNNRGNAKSELRRHEEALADYDEAIRLKSDNAEAYCNRGDTKNDLGQYEGAIADCDEAIRLKPDLVEAYCNRGNAKSGFGRHEHAIADYGEAIRLKPDFAEAYGNRGKANISLNRIDEARQDFETAITLARDAGDETLANDAERALKELLDEQAP